MSYMQLTYLHLGTLAPAFVLGTYLLINRKGTPAHQLLGKLYMGLMLFIATVTLFTNDELINSDSFALSYSSCSFVSFN